MVVVAAVNVALVPRMALKIPVFELSELTTNDPPVAFVKKRSVEDAVSAKKFVEVVLTPVAFVQSNDERLSGLAKVKLFTVRFVKVAFVAKRLVAVALVKRASVI